MRHSCSSFLFHLIEESTSKTFEFEMVGYKPTRGQVLWWISERLSLSLSPRRVQVGWEDCTMQKKVEELMHGQVDGCKLPSLPWHSNLQSILHYIIQPFHHDKLCNIWFGRFMTKFLLKGSTKVWHHIRVNVKWRGWNRWFNLEPWVYENQHNVVKFY